MTAIDKVADLDALLDVLVETSNTRHVDMTSLPTFGGAEPASTIGVWSWDAERVLVGTCSDDFKIVARADWESD